MNADRRYFRDESPPLTVELSTGLVLSLFALAGITHGIALTIGLMLAEPEKVFVTNTKTVAPLTQWSCTAAERQEVARVCAARARSSMTRPQ